MPDDLSGTPLGKRHGGPGDSSRVFSTGALAAVVFGILAVTAGVTVGMRLKKASPEKGQREDDPPSHLALADVVERRIDIEGMREEVGWVLTPDEATILKTIDRDMRVAKAIEHEDLKGALARYERSAKELGAILAERRRRAETARIAEEKRKAEEARRMREEARLRAEAEAKRKAAEEARKAEEARRAREEAAHGAAMTKAWSLVGMEKWEEAATACEEALRRKPDDAEARKLLAAMRAPSPRAGTYGSRGGGGRLKAALSGGGSWESEAAVGRALEWLWRHQESAGHWEGERRFEADDPGKNTDAGVTGLALLAFLGAGHTEKTGLAKYQVTVRKAVAWLIKHQEANGAIGEGYEGGLGYHHAIGGLALAEAFGMAKIPRTGRAAQKAVNYSLGVHQSEDGGWRYKPRTPADVSVTGWFVMQLKSAKTAGLRAHGKGFRGASTFLGKCTKENGLVSYQPGRSPTPTMTAVGLLCWQSMGRKRDNPVVKTGADYLMNSLPEWEGGNVNFYYWYYGTLAMFQMGGDRWKQWNASLRDMLIERQRKGAPKIDGSWDPIGSWCGSGGRVFATASGCLCLEVYYRYRPIYKDQGRSWEEPLTKTPRRRE